MGRADYAKLGTHNAICDRCGFKYKADELREEWTGWMVCDHCWEPRHPQEFLKGQPENENVPWTRPDAEDAVVEYVGDEGKTLTKGVDLDIQIWNTELTEDRVVILSSVGAQSGDRFTIYKTEDDDNKLIIK